MPEISAAQVQALRARTDLPLMDCKRALMETGGNEEAALEILRKKFADKMGTRADRETANGRIGAYSDERGGALVEVRCETDFVANNSVFVGLANNLARQVAATHIKEPGKLMESACEFAGGRKVKELFAEAFGKLNEKMELRRGQCVHGACANYIHHNGRVGALVTMEKPNDVLARQICMHVASRQVLLALNREGVESKLVSEAREAVQAEIRNKPLAIVDKIVSGKMDKWFSERVLLEQPYALDDTKSVGMVARENGATLTGYLRFELGERV